MIWRPAPHRILVNSSLAARSRPRLHTGTIALSVMKLQAPKYAPASQAAVMLSFQARTSASPAAGASMVAHLYNTPAPLDPLTLIPAHRATTESPKHSPRALPGWRGSGHMVPDGFGPGTAWSATVSRTMKPAAGAACRPARNREKTGALQQGGDSMFFDLQDKIVLVTGASTGIGAAVAGGFAAQGARVAMNYGSSTAEAEGVRDGIAAAGGEAQLFQADIADPGAAARMVAGVVSHFGGLDVVVCNAGGLVGRKGLVEIAGEFYDRVMDLNVRSVVTTCAAAIPHLIESRGNVIVTGSIAARTGGGAGASLYAASKAAVQNLVETYAREYAGQGVRFNSVAPGTIDTLFHRKHTRPEVLEAVRASIPMQRLGTPGDCVGAYLFLASDALAGYVTGQTAEVNGGQLMP